MHTNSKTVIFIHIPKAAGTTFYQVLNHQYKTQHIFYFKEGTSKQATIDLFRQLPTEKKAYLRCIRGHIPFGLHQWLPQPATYLTILRNPVERVVSYYYFVRNTPRHLFHKEVIEKNFSLEDFIRKMMDINETNLQTRWVAGCVDFDSVISPYGDLPANALDLAKKNLESFFSVCGLTERFDESLLLMQKIHSWKNIFYKRKNIGTQRKVGEKVSASTLRLIEKNEEQDLELYEFAGNRLAEMLDSYMIGDKQVQKFRFLNRLLGVPVWACSAVRRRLIAKVKNIFRISDKALNLRNNPFEHSVQ